MTDRPRQIKTEFKALPLCAHNAHNDEKLTNAQRKMTQNPCQSAKLPNPPELDKLQSIKFPLIPTL